MDKTNKNNYRTCDNMSSCSVFSLFIQKIANASIRRCRHTGDRLGLSFSVPRWVVMASLGNPSLGGACACGAAAHFHTSPSSTKIRSS